MAASPTAVTLPAAAASGALRLGAGLRRIAPPAITPLPATVQDNGLVRVGAGLRRAAPHTAPQAATSDAGRVRVGAGLRRL